MKFCSACVMPDTKPEFGWTTAAFVMPVEQKK